MTTPDDPYQTPAEDGGAQPPPPPGYPPPDQPPYGQPAYGQPPYGQPPYGQQPYQHYGYPQPASTNGFAIASLVCAFLCWPLGLVFGFIARSQIRQNGQQGSGLATAGIVISAVFAALLVIVIVVGAASTTTTPQY
jgi:hypothetical protein